MEAPAHSLHDVYSEGVYEQQPKFARPPLVVNEMDGSGTPRSAELDSVVRPAELPGSSAGEVEPKWR